MASIAGGRVASSSELAGLVAVSQLRKQHPSQPTAPTRARPLGRGLAMARKKTGRLTHWGCWNYPGTAIRTACRATLTKTRYRRLWPEKKGTAQEYIDAYDADPMTHCETCRKKAVWYDREKERFLADETERLAAQVAEEV